MPALDGLRGIAILAVLAHNLQLLQSPTGSVGRAVEMSLDRGWTGVQLFFALSGFLITGILLDTQKASNYFRSFFSRRALRIFPLYYLTLLVLCVLLPAAHVFGPSLVPGFDRQWPFWIYVSNWTQPYGGWAGFVTHFWSLAVEEQFYLLWPLLIHRLNPVSTLRLCLAIAVASFVIRVSMQHFGFETEAIYMFSVCRMDALALGGAAAAALRIESVRERLSGRAGTIAVVMLLLGAAGAVVTHGYPRTSSLGQSVGYSALAATFALAVLACAVADGNGVRGPFAVLRFAPLRALGKYSYAVYIFHKPLNDLVGAPLAAALFPRAATDVGPTLVYLPVMLLVCVALAALSYRFIEMPFLRLKTRFEPDPPEPTLALQSR
jgi:peptidoglycan/LPS O-acetylase OafA/YrhL